MHNSGHHEKIPPDDVLSRIADMTDLELDTVINNPATDTRPRVRKRQRFDFDTTRDERRAALTFGRVAKRRAMTSRWSTDALASYTEHTNDDATDAQYFSDSSIT